MSLSAENLISDQEDAEPGAAASAASHCSGGPNREPQSEFVKQLNFSRGHQFTHQDLKLLTAENKNLQRKVETCRENKTKFDKLELEIKFLRYGYFLKMQQCDIY